MLNELVNADFSQRVVIDTSTVPWGRGDVPGHARIELHAAAAGHRRSLHSSAGVTYWAKRGHLRAPGELP
jgi:hypothetical protein